MHHIYHTTAFVLGHADIKEADRFFILFTRELGVIRATAQGIRKLSSRLRYGLQDFSYARVDLVRGKDVWRITSATKIETEGLYILERLALFARILELVRRLYQGEEAVESVFKTVQSLLMVLGTKQELSKEILLGLEYISVLHILSELGYVSPDGMVAVYLLGDLSLEKASDAYIDRQELLKIINTAIGETQL